MSDDRRQPGRPSLGRRTTTAIRFDVDLHRRLEEAAAERELSINYIVNRACEQFLDRLIPVDQMQWTHDPSGTRAP